MTNFFIGLSVGFILFPTVVLVLALLGTWIFGRGRRDDR